MSVFIDIDCPFFPPVLFMLADPHLDHLNLLHRPSLLGLIRAVFLSFSLIRFPSISSSPFPHFLSLFLFFPFTRCLPVSHFLTTTFTVNTNFPSSCQSRFFFTQDLQPNACEEILLLRFCTTTNFVHPNLGSIS